MRYRLPFFLINDRVKLLAYRILALVVYFINTRTFVAPHLSQGEARRRRMLCAPAHIPFRETESQGLGRPSKWSQWPGLNRRPTVYETVALPLSYIGITFNNSHLQLLF
jgi:hypothetical protein